MKESRGAREIKANFKDQEKEDNKNIALKTTLIDLFISHKDDNQRSITLIYNNVYYASIKHIDI